MKGARPAVGSVFGGVYVFIHINCCRRRWYLAYTSRDVSAGFSAGADATGFLSVVLRVFLQSRKICRPYMALCRRFLRQCKKNCCGGRWWYSSPFS